METKEYFWVKSYSEDKVKIKEAFKIDDCSNEKKDQKALICLFEEIIIKGTELNQMFEEKIKGIKPSDLMDEEKSFRSRMTQEVGVYFSTKLS